MVGLLDIRPRLTGIPVLFRCVRLSYEPDIWIILTYVFLCSLEYSLKVVQVSPLIQLYRLLFDFSALRVIVFAPSGASNYPLSIISSILSAVKLKLEVRSFIFWIGLPGVSFCRATRKFSWGTPASIRDFGVVCGQAALTRLGRVLREGKKLIFLALLLYTLMYSASLTYQQAQIDLITSHSNQPTERVVVSDCVQWVVTRANGTIQRSPPCNSGGSSNIKIQRAFCEP